MYNKSENNSKRDSVLIYLGIIAVFLVGVCVGFLAALQYRI